MFTMKNKIGDLNLRTPLVYLMSELCSTTVDIVPVAQHGGGARSGDFICASLESSGALVL